MILRELNRCTDLLLKLGNRSDQNLNDKYKFDIKNERPEDTFENIFDFYDSNEISRYAESKSLMNIQEKITIRALEILELTEKNALILDLGCGPGFAGIYLNEIGYKVISIDLLLEFLQYYNIKELNPIQSDMSFLPFRPYSFDAIISISALQWLHRTYNMKDTIQLIKSLAKDVYNVLKPTSKAIFQFYPKNDSIMKEIGKGFMDATQFEGGFIIDNPNSAKKRRVFLILNKN